ncbi:MAG: HAD family hydrolase [Solirubrobacteraceae bacterium]
MQLEIASTRALLIDGLGTLLSLTPPAPALARELERQFGLRVSEAEAQRALAAEISFYRSHMGEGRDADSLVDLRRRCAAVLRDALPPARRPPAAAIDRLTAALLDSLRFEPFADARDALVQARRHGARVVVVSNWDVSLSDVLERTGLAPLLHGVVTSAAIGARKPAAAIFEHALALSGAAPAEALHVGDSLDEDVAGARSCGIPALLVCRGGVSAPAGVATITGLAELKWP